MSSAPDRGFTEWGRGREGYDVGREGESRGQGCLGNQRSRVGLFNLAEAISTLGNILTGLISQS